MGMLDELAPCQGDAWLMRLWGGFKEKQLMNFFGWAWPIREVARLHRLIVKKSSTYLMKVLCSCMNFRR